jgi:hypothetical protein
VTVFIWEAPANAGGFFVDRACAVCLGVEERVGLNNHFSKSVGKVWELFHI